MEYIPRIELKEEAKQVLRMQLLPFALATLIFFAIEAVMSFFSGDYNNNAEPTFLMVLVSLISVGVSGTLTIGMASMSLKAFKGKPVKASNVFDGFENLGQSLGLSYLLVIKVFLWSLLFIVPGIIASLRYAMSYYLVVEDPKLGASDALKKSGEMMMGHKWEFFVLGLSFILWYLLIPLTLGLAIFWVLPYQQLTYAAFYRRLKGESFGTAKTEFEQMLENEKPASHEEAVEAVKAAMSKNADEPVIDEVVAAAEPVVEEAEPEVATAEPVAEEAVEASKEEAPLAEDGYQPLERPEDSSKPDEPEA